jgi:hypothetical protein
MNKKSIDKIEIMTLDFNYSSFLKDIYNIKNLNDFISFITHDIQKKEESVYIYDRLLEYGWYVFIDEIIINKNTFINFYIQIIKKVYNKDISFENFEIIYNDNIKLYLKEKNNLNYHKIILNTI